VQEAGAVELVAGGGELAPVAKSQEELVVVYEPLAVLA